MWQNLDFFFKRLPIRLLIGFLVIMSFFPMFSIMPQVVLDCQGPLAFAFVWLVGDYFAPTKSRAALQCQPGFQATINSDPFMRNPFDELDLIFNDALAGNGSF